VKTKSSFVLVLVLVLDQSQLSFILGSFRGIEDEDEDEDDAISGFFTHSPQACVTTGLPWDKSKIANLEWTCRIRGTQPHP
jgi:hypothetical protein